MNLALRNISDRKTKRVIPIPNPLHCTSVGLIGVDLGLWDITDMAGESHLVYGGQVRVSVSEGRVDLDGSGVTL